MMFVDSCLHRWYVHALENTEWLLVTTLFLFFSLFSSSIYLPRVNLNTHHLVSTSENKNYDYIVIVNILMENTSIMYVHIIHSKYKQLKYFIC